MAIKRINEFPEGSGSLTSDDVFLFMDDPSGNKITKKISLSQLGSIIGGGGGGGNPFDQDLNTTNFPTFSGVSLSNTSTLAQGTFDNGAGGNGGISLNCYVGYELNWQGGHLKSTQDNGVSSANIWCDSPIEFPGSGLDNMQIDSSGITFPDGTTQSSANISSANITDFNSSVSGLLTGLQPSGNYANNSHTHTIDNVTDLQTTLDNKAGTTVTQVFTSSGTWTKPTGAKVVHVVAIGGGGGGGSGGSSSSGPAAGGGGGGGGAGRTFVTLDAALLGSTEAVTVGAGGPGAVSSAIGNSGTNGVAGGRSYFGTSSTAWVTADNGNGGFGGNLTGGSGTGGSSAARSLFPGGSGGSGGSGATGGASGNSTQGAGGGGGGGSIGSGNTVFSAGSGGFSLAAVGIPTSTAAGVAGVSAPANSPFAGAGGGGGSSSTTAAGQAGGNGGLYGAGGGGGGASVGHPSGSGGNGANGIVIVTTYF